MILYSNIFIIDLIMWNLITLSLQTFDLYLFSEDTAKKTQP